MSGPADAAWPCALLSSGGDGLITDVNDTFVSWTGHRREDVVGRRRVRDLLTGGGRIMYETHLGPLLAMQGSVSEVALDLRCADGTALPILLNATTAPAGGVARQSVRFALVVASERRSYERQLLEARHTAEGAVAASERAQGRLRLVVDVNTMLSGTRELEVALPRLAEMLAGERDGCCVIVTHLDGPQQPRRVMASGAGDPGNPLTRLGVALARSLRPGAVHPLLPECELTALLAAPEPQLALHLRVPATGADDDVTDDTADGAHLELAASIVVPVRARDRQVATILLSRAAAAASYGEDDLLEIAALADRIGLFIDNLRLYGREHDRAVALQRALLTPPARPPGFDIVTRYLPSADDAMVGGDWYDSFIRADGATVIVIGDVIGHDHLAAAAMGQLRGLLRALAYTACQPPGELLAAVDIAARGLGVGTLATVVVVVFEADERAGGGPTVSWSSAGHLPPALITVDGDVRLLDVKADLMLGVEPGRARTTHLLDWRPDCTLLLYTDGLVEDRSRGLDDGLGMLVGILRELAPRELDGLCDELISVLSTPYRGDDIAVLAIRNRRT